MDAVSLTICVLESLNVVGHLVSVLSINSYLSKLQEIDPLFDWTF